MHPYDQYELVIGLETHIQLATQSKAFCADQNRFGEAPNTQLSPISLGHPGTLPVLNEQQLSYAVRLGLALNSRINTHCHFDRKHYFYADLPKGYQITQDTEPICIGGALEILVNDQAKPIRIHHIHMEEDAGKSIHDMNAAYTLIDLNRAGVPLLEVVSEPDFRSAEEVDAYMTAMRQLVRYLGISDGNMEEGSLRCDVNISVRKKGETSFGERCEIKNMNSMRFARRAIEFEAKRQIDILETGGTVAQQTLNFDPVSGQTSPLREKEDAHDYRYFPEPDLAPIALSDEYVDAIKQAIPGLPWEYRHRFENTFRLSPYDARLLTEELATAQYFEKLADQTVHHKAVANLLINKLLPLAKERQCPLDQLPCSAVIWIAFIELIESGKVSHSVAYQQLFPELLAHPDEPPEALAARLDILQQEDTDFLSQLADEVIAAHPEKVKTYKNGKKGLLGFFMGELMRASRGKANPAAAKALLGQKLDS